MPKRSDAYMAERRRHILDALERCVKRDGWDRATIDEVAREADLSKGAVYVHFDSKRALLIGLVRRDLAAAERTLSGIETVAQLRTDMREGLGQLARREGWRVVAGALETQIDGVRDPEIRKEMVVGADRVIALLAQVVQRLCPGVDPATARLRAIGLLTFMYGINTFRGVCDSLTKADIYALIDAQIEMLAA